MNTASILPWCIYLRYCVFCSWRQNKTAALSVNTAVSLWFAFFIELRIDLAKLRNTFCGTSFYAFAAIRAFVGIYVSKEVNNAESSRFADLLAFHTSDATNRTDLSCFGALVVIGTTYNGLLLDGHDRDQVLGASGNTLTAGTAKTQVYFSNAVTDRDSVIWTCIHTVAESDTTERTAAFSAEKLYSCGAAL